MPPTETDEGIQAAARLRETSPDVGVVVLSHYASPAYALALLEGGSARRGYLLRSGSTEIEQLVDAIRAVAAGGSVIDPKVVEELVAGNARGEESPLERADAARAGRAPRDGRGQEQRGDRRDPVLTERSVEKVIHSIFAKLGLTWEAAVHKRVKAVILYLAESP